MKTNDPIVKYISFEDLLENDGYLVYTNVGVSMMPLLRQCRDIIEIHKKDPNVRCKKYDVGLYKYHNQYILHRILEVRPFDYVFAGDHCFKREYGITDEQILGVMTRVIRNGKSIYPSDWYYKLYVHLWCDFYHIRAGILLANNILHKLCYKIKAGILSKYKNNYSDKL